MVNVLPIAGYLAWQPVIPVLPFLALMALAAAALVLTVRHVRDAAGRRAAALTGTVRGCAFALVLAALAQPMIHRRGGADEGRTVLALVDVSASMAARCADGETRLEHARRMLAEVRAALPETWRWEVRPFTDRMGAAATNAAALTPAADAAPVPTDIPAALAGAMAAARGGGAAAVLLLGDGGDEGAQSAVPGTVPLVAAGVGDATRPSPDLAVTALAAPEAVERETAFRVTARIEARGGAPFLRQTAALAARLLRQEAGGAFTEVARAAVDASSGAGDVSFETRCGEAGQAVFRVEVAPAAGEPVVLNNRRSVAVNVRQSAVDVLFFARQIGADLKFLRQELASDPSLRFTALYRAGEGRYTVQGDAAADPSLANGLPVEVEALRRFDCILLGSFPAEAWTAAEMGALLAYVEGGGGVVWLGGDDSFDGGGYADSPLRPLIPWQAPGRGGSSLARGVFPVEVAAAAAAATAGLEDLVRGASAEELRGLAVTSLNRAEGLLPGAQVLLAALADGATAPLVVEHRYGKGRVFSVASNTTWLWARTPGVPERFYRRFWRQAVRAAAGRGEGGTHLTAVWNRSAYRPGDRVEVELRGEGGDGLRLRAARLTGGRRTALAAEREGAADVWRTGWHVEGREATRFEAVLEAGEKPLETYARTVPLALPADEGSCPVPDPEAFRALAEASGGVWAADAATAAAALWEAVGPRERVIVTGLTDSPWFLAAAAGLTVIELALRRRFGLL